MKFLGYFKKISPEAKYILLLFLVTRVVLTVIGITARILISHSTFAYPLGLDIWCVWDCGWYKNIASEGYSTASPDQGQQNYAFFPLYPLLMSRLASAIGVDVFVAGIILSNIFLLASCFFLYKLVKLDDTERTALNAVKYLFLFPTAFVFSGILSESLFMMLMLACFYYARKAKWAISGLFGLLLALTRNIGVFIIIPIAYEYLKEKNFSIKKIRKDALLLLLIPLGLILWGIYNHYLTGDFFAFLHVQGAWGNGFKNMILTLTGMSHSNINGIIQGALTTILLIFLILSYKKIRFSYWLTGIYSIILPVTYGQMYSILRYLSLVFPFYIIFAKYSENKRLDQVLTICMAMLQGFMMVFWTTYRDLVI